MYNIHTVKQRISPYFLNLSAFFFSTAFGIVFGAGLITPENFAHLSPLKVRETGPIAGPVKPPRVGPLRIPIAIYHSVRPHIKGESAYQEMYDVTPELLAEQVEYLREKGFTNVTFAEVADYFDHGTPLPSKPVILSFDDSWRNQYRYALPVLKKAHATSTFYVFTNSIDNGNHLSLEEIKEIKNAGMEIGSHTKLHPYLNEIASAAILADEIDGSKKILEKKLGSTITTFAYPFGEHASSSIDEVERSGYKTARSICKDQQQDRTRRFTMCGFIVSDDIEDFKKSVGE